MKKHLALAAAVGALVPAALAVTLLDDRGGPTAVQTDDRGGVAWIVPADALPPGFAPGDGPTRLEPAAQATQPVVATWYSTDTAGELLVVEGPHDALESGFTPERPEAVQISTGRGLVGRAAERSLVLVANPDLPPEVVSGTHLVISEPGADTAAVLDAAASLTAGALPATWRRVASGDIAPFLGAGSGTEATYVDDEGSILSVQTFPNHRLGEVMEFFGPPESADAPDGSRGAVFVGGADAAEPTIAVDYPDALVIVTSAAAPGAADDVDIEALAAELEED